METGKEEIARAIVTRTGIIIVMKIGIIETGDPEDRLSGTIAITEIVETIGITGIIEIIEITEIIGAVEITETTGIIEAGIIGILVTTEIITVIQIRESVGKDVPRIGIETGRIVFKIEIGTNTGETIIGREETEKIEVIVRKDIPIVREDRLIMTEVRRVFIVRKSKLNFARKTKDRKQNYA